MIARALGLGVFTSGKPREWRRPRIAAMDGTYWHSLATFPRLAISDLQATKPVRVESLAGFGTGAVVGDMGR